jgi:hypothetical protein
VVPENVLKRVDPTHVGAMFVPIPVRIIVDTAGRVKHVRVIHATPSSAGASRRLCASGHSSLVN